MAVDITKQNILLVGVGGVGSEILKNLIISGFENLTLVDMDTIELSNLNRQLLFRTKDIGRAKVAAARDFCARNTKAGRHLNIQTFTKSILDIQFDIFWFKSYDIVVNALDNIEARIHVSRMCHLGRIPLVETGTGGFNGQCELFSGASCYECDAPRTQTTLPVCTIRNEPTDSKHTLVWAKYCFIKLFTQEDSTLASDVFGEEKMNDVTINDVFDRFFFQKKKIIMQKKIRESLKLLKEDNTTQFNRSMFDRYIIHNVDDLILIIKFCFSELQKSKISGNIKEWDKDDFLSMLFVYAAANLRNMDFDIFQCTFWEAKTIIGKIIPAVSTSNAIIAGVTLLQIQRILDRKDFSSGFVKLQQYFIDGGEMLVSNQSPERRPDCRGCEKFVEHEIQLDYNKISLLMFGEEILKKQTGITDPRIVYNKSVLLSRDYEEDEAMRSFYEMPFNNHDFPDKICFETNGSKGLQHVFFISKKAHKSSSIKI